ncbi:tRNA3(Ser)-specific nuclease WapA precursor [Stieleria neptunia]|uniref:tRNA3(Ser)-specific nuclease WapA n=1 Tax=Stieleria neptunia TaxID=2527979 RepID=A0A518HW46_9BACT|nr:tRNA3(Ser)-specific nuclease WapA precursor [Stieleria neptunia]
MLCKPSSRRCPLQRRLARRRAGGVKSCVDSKRIRSCKTLRQQTCPPDKSLTENDAPTIKLAFRYHGTQQYSVTALTDSSGTIKERYAYDAYGNLSIFDGSGTARTSTAEGNRYTYTGREWDDVLDLYHYRARMYDSVSGRFLSRDPIGYSGSTWNLFELVQSSPLDSLDPSGLVQLCSELLCAKKRCIDKSSLSDSSKTLLKTLADNSFQECNNELAPYAVAEAVRLALLELGLDLQPDPFRVDEDKAGLTIHQILQILGSGINATPSVTISGSRAWTIRLPSGWELKIYEQPGGSFRAAVGNPTFSASHVVDAACWLSGVSPNGANSESYGGFVVHDAGYANQLEKLRKAGCGCLNASLFSQLLANPNFGPGPTIAPRN